MDFIDVLRFEDSQGRGPYCSPFSPYGDANCLKTPAACRLKVLMHGHHDMRHPDPHQIGEPWDVGGRRDGDVCGFKDLDQVCDWFSDEEVELLLDFGFSLVSYRVPAHDVTIGNMQVCFVKCDRAPSIILQARSAGSDGRSEY